MTQAASTDRDEFSVAVFYYGGWWEYAEELIGARQAVEAAARIAKSVAGRTGMIVEIRVTDGGDDTVMQWKYGEGLTFPPAPP